MCSFDQVPRVWSYALVNEASEWSIASLPVSRTPDIDLSGCSDVDQPGGPNLPVLRTGQGRRPAQGQAPLLFGRPLLPVCAVDPNGKRYPSRASGGTLTRAIPRPHRQESGYLGHPRNGPSPPRQGRVQWWGPQVPRSCPAWQGSAVRGVRSGPRPWPTQRRSSRPHLGRHRLGRWEPSVGRQLQRVRGQLLHRDTKSQASEAVLPLPDGCVSALRLRKAQQAEARSAAGTTWQESDLVFTTRYGTPIEPRNFRRSWQLRCDRLITVHDARRTCASLLADLDVHPRVAM